MKPQIGNETSTEQGHYSRRGLQTGIKGEDAGGEPTMPEGPRAKRAYSIEAPTVRGIRGLLAVGAAKVSLP